MWVCTAEATFAIVYLEAIKETIKRRPVGSGASDQQPLWYYITWNEWTIFQRYLLHEKGNGWRV